MIMNIFKLLFIRNPIGSIGLALRMGYVDLSSAVTCCRLSIVMFLAYDGSEERGSVKCACMCVLESGERER